MKTKRLTHHYSNKIAHKKILIIGPYPPPLGGVSIHIKRVVTKLEKQNNLVIVYNTANKYPSKFSSFKNLITTLFKTKPEIVFYHEPTESIQKLFVTVFLKLFLRYKLTTIDHDCRLLYNFSKTKKFFFRILIKRSDTCVVIGNTTHTCYIDNGLNPSVDGIHRSANKLSIESPFLPPDTTNEKTIFQNYPPAVHDFIKNRSPLITANAFTPALYNEKDLYGFDLCIELINELKKTSPHVGLLFGICKIETEKQKKYFATIQERIKKLNLENHFYFYIDAPEFWVLIKRSNLFVRPTLSDSFGISVHEAIHTKTKVIASDTCWRPAGTILFETGNKDNFITTSKHALKKTF